MMFHPGTKRGFEKSILYPQIRSAFLSHSIYSLLVVCPNLELLASPKECPHFLQSIKGLSSLRKVLCPLSVLKLSAVAIEAPFLEQNNGVPQRHGSLPNPKLHNNTYHKDSRVSESQESDPLSRQVVEGASLLMIAKKLTEVTFESQKFEFVNPALDSLKPSLAMLCIKLKRSPDASTILEFFDALPSWENLSSKIAKVFNIPSTNVGVAYVHKDRESITLTNNRGLQQYFSEQSCEEFKFVVQDIHKPDPATIIASTWSAASNLFSLSNTNNDIKLFCLLISPSNPIFSVDINKNLTVDDLRIEIKKTMEATFPHYELHLWKMDPPVPSTEVGQPQSLDDIKGLIRLHPMSVLSAQFLLPLGLDVHVIVMHIPSGKRPGSPIGEESELGSKKIHAGLPNFERNSNAPESKRLKLNNGEQDNRLPSESTLASLHKMLTGVQQDLDWYSKPHNCSLLPFLFNYPKIPERFSLKDGRFQYMGREIFQEVYNKVSSLTLTGLSSLYIYGTMGYGKSYILAALTCLLYRQGKRVVFIPDCRAMLANPLIYIKCALLCTFANPSLKEQRQRIRELTSLDELDAFSHSLSDTTLYFIVDQVNALEKSSCNTDTISDNDKDAGQKLINALSSGNFLITSASANYQTARHMAKKQTGEKKMSLMGGMSNIEMVQWWKHHKNSLPKFRDEEEMRDIQDFTGCIPLLLRPLFEFGRRDFSAVENDFRAASEIVAVGLNIKEFADERSKLGESLYSDYVNTLFNCLTRGDAPSNRSESFDYRYFYHDGKSGECACGAARAAAAVIIAKWKISRFYEPKWIDSLRIFKDNPSTLGFQIEKICLGCIADIGLNYAGKHMGPKAPTWFRGNKLDDLFQAIPSDLSGLYLPLNPQFEDLDALALEFDTKTNRLHVIPIQVTISKRHKDSEALFYNKWEKWRFRFPGIKLHSTFIWIVEDTKSTTMIKGEVRETRTTKQPKSQDHFQIYLSAGDVHKPLGEALKRIRDLQNQDPMQP